MGLDASLSLAALSSNCSKALSVLSGALLYSHLKWSTNKDITQRRRGYLPSAVTEILQNECFCECSTSLPSPCYFGALGKRRNWGVSVHVAWLKVPMARWDGDSTCVTRTGTASEIFWSGVQPHTNTWSRTLIRYVNTTALFRYNWRYSEIMKSASTLQAFISK